jgi:hypothetical protein
MFCTAKLSNSICCLPEDDDENSGRSDDHNDDIGDHDLLKMNTDHSSVGVYLHRIPF